MHERSALGLRRGEGGSPEGRALEPASDGVVAGGVPVLGREDTDDLTECDCCGELKPDLDLIHSWQGEVLACGDCRDYDPFLEYKTRVYRGLEDW